MKNDKSKNGLSAEEEKELFSKISVNYPKSKADVWAAIEDKIENTSPKETNVFYLQPWAMGVAASLTLLLCVGIFAKFYTTNVSVQAGDMASHTLPDGSVVNINAASQISYAPYWWAISREVELAGEAFFEVEKGSAFQVKSPQGTTQVLGTSFNIYARNTDYQVFCATGKVSVNAPKSEEVILTPNQFTELVGNDLVKKENDKKKNEVLSWRTGKFIYNSTPLERVLKDFERFYDTQLTIEIENIETYPYTGAFERSVSLQTALEIVCSSFDFKLEKKSDTTFLIIGK